MPRKFACEEAKSSSEMVNVKPFKSIAGNGYDTFVVRISFIKIVLIILLWSLPVSKATDSYEVHLEPCTYHFSKTATRFFVARIRNIVLLGKHTRINLFPLLMLTPSVIEGLEIGSRNIQQFNVPETNYSKIVLDYFNDLVPTITLDWFYFNPIRNSYFNFFLVQFVLQQCIFCTLIYLYLKRDYPTIYGYLLNRCITIQNCLDVIDDIFLHHREMLFMWMFNVILFEELFMFSKATLYILIILHSQHLRSFYKTFLIGFMLGCFSVMPLEFSIIIHLSWDSYCFYRKQYDIMCMFNISSLHNNKRDIPNEDKKLPQKDNGNPFPNNFSNKVKRKIDKDLKDLYPGITGSKRDLVVNKNKHTQKSKFMIADVDDFIIPNYDDMNLVDYELSKRTLRDKHKYKKQNLEFPKEVIRFASYITAMSDCNSHRGYVSTTSLLLLTYNYTFEQISNIITSIISSLVEEFTLPQATNIIDTLFQYIMKTDMKFSETIIGSRISNVFSFVFFAPIVSICFGTEKLLSLKNYIESINVPITVLGNISELFSLVGELFATGLECIYAGNLSPFLKADKYLQLHMDYTDLCSKHIDFHWMTEKEYVCDNIITDLFFTHCTQLIKTIDSCLLVSKNSKSPVYTGGMLHSMRIKILEIVQLYKSRSYNAEMRETPFALVFYGDPKCGKSDLINYTAHYLGAILGINSDTNNRVNLNTEDQFLSNWTTQEIALLPDLVSRQPDYVQTPMDFLKFIDSAPVCMNKASLEEKGNVFSPLKLFIGGSNILDLKVGDIFYVKSAPLRRFVFVEVKLQPNHFPAKYDPDLIFKDTVKYNVLTIVINGSSYDYQIHNADGTIYKIVVPLHLANEVAILTGREMIACLGILAKDHQTREHDAVVSRRNIGIRRGMCTFHKAPYLTCSCVIAGPKIIVKQSWYKKLYDFYRKEQPQAGFPIKLFIFCYRAQSFMMEYIPRELLLYYYYFIELIWYYILKTSLFVRSFFGISNLIRSANNINDSINHSTQIFENNMADVGALTGRSLAVLIQLQNDFKQFIRDMVLSILGTLGILMTSYILFNTYFEKVGSKLERQTLANIKDITIFTETNRFLHLKPLGEPRQVMVNPTTRPVVTDVYSIEKVDSNFKLARKREFEKAIVSIVLPSIKSAFIGINICSNIIICNEHSLPLSTDLGMLITYPDNVKPINKSGLYYCDTTSSVKLGDDIVAVVIPLLQRGKDLSKYLVKDHLIPGKGYLFRFNKTYDIDIHVDKLFGKEGKFLKYCAPDMVGGTSGSFIVSCAEDTFNGVGIHCLGSESDNLGWGSVFTTLLPSTQSKYEGYSMLDEFTTYGKTLVIENLSERSELFHLKNDHWCGNVLGTCSSLVTGTPTSKLVKLPVHPYLNGLQLMDLEIPILRAFTKNDEYISPYLKKMFESMLPKPIKSLSMLECVITRVVNYLLPFIDPDTRPDNLLEVLNAAEGLKAIKISTAAGAPLKGKKEKYILNQDNGLKILDQEICEMLMSMNKCFQLKLNPNSIIPLNPKDEPVSQVKIDSGNVRLFCSTPMPQLIMANSLYLPIFRNIISNRKKCAIKIGLNCLGPEWMQLYDYLSPAEKLDFLNNVLLDADFGSYDVTNDTTWAVSQVIERIIATLKNYINHMTQVKGLSETYLQYTMSSKGDLVELFNVPAPGRGGTAEWNSIGNLIIWCMICYMIDPSIDPFLLMLLAVYGDDTVLKPSDRMLKNIPEPEVLKNLFVLLGHSVTNGSDKTRPLEYVTIDKISFLKRKFRIDNNRCFAPIAEKSILKSLAFYTVNSGMSKREYVIEVILQAASQYFMYGKQVYEEKLFFLNDLIAIYENDLELSNLDIHFKTYEEILEIYDKGEYQDWMA